MSRKASPQDMIEDSLKLVTEAMKTGKPLSAIGGDDPSGSSYLVNDAELIQKILAKHHQSFVEEKHPFHFTRPFLGDDGRAALSMERPKDLDAFVRRIKICSLSHCKNDFSKWDSTQEIDVFPLLAKTTLSMMCEILFKHDFTDDRESFFAAAMEHEEFLTLLRRGPFELRDDLDFRRQGRLSIEKQVAIMEKISKKNDLRPRKDKPDKMPTGYALVRTLLNAYAGVASAMSWSSVVLSSNEDLQSELRKEAIESGENEGPLIESFIKEILRYYPAAWMMTREAVETIEVDGHQFQKGDMVLISTYSLHRDPKYWDDPERFDPKRFIDQEAPKYAYLPFGAGPHRCAGSYVAMICMRVILSEILREFSLEKSRQEVIPFPRVSLRPFPGAFLRVSRIN